MSSELLSVADADRLLSTFSGTAGGLWPAEGVPLAAAAGRILREDIRADRAYPAQDRSRMDGIAISFAAWEKGARRFPVAGIAPAGSPRGNLLDASSCIEIMTGAPLPEGADTVIRYEDVEIHEGIAEVRSDAVVRAGQNIHPRGSDCAPGDVLVPSGVRLQAAQIAVAASVGKNDPLVARRPRVAILATGDELVAVDQVPLPHQLRVSNASGLAALLAPWAETRVHRVGDDPAALAATLRAVLSSFDLVLVSGGVSAGKFDAVPAALESLGVEKVFHKLAQKPGKPLWFGTYGSTGMRSSPLPLGEGSGVRVPPEEGSATKAPAPEIPAVPVFGLPGNPVSALVCARRFVLPLLWGKLGWTETGSQTFLPLGSAVEASPRLTQYMPVRLVTRAVPRAEPGGPSGFETVAEPRAVNGSGDFATLGGSDGFVELPPSEKHYPAGARMAFFAWTP